MKRTDTWSSNEIGAKLLDHEAQLLDAKALDDERDLARHLQDAEYSEDQLLTRRRVAAAYREAAAELRAADAQKAADRG